MGIIKLMKAILNDGGPLIIAPTFDYINWGGEEINGKYGTVLEDYEAICRGSETASKEAEFIEVRGRLVLTFGTQHLHQALFYRDKEHLYALGYIFGEMPEAETFRLTSSNTEWETIGKISLTSPGLTMMHGAFGGGEITLLDSKTSDTEMIDLVTIQYGISVDLVVAEYICELWQHKTDANHFIAVQFRRV
jgi:hypothetical protein